MLRKRFEIELGELGLTEQTFAYICSLSARTIVYKGLLLADQVDKYYPDLSDARMTSALALVHQRYSTNTFPTWDLAHPFRFIAHNGEINTVRGNINWMHARESMLAHPVCGPDMAKIAPVVRGGGSDSATFDNVLELLVLAGRPIEEVVSMLIPEPWSGHESMPDDLKAYYEYQACLMEPWDGPAALAFTDVCLPEAGQQVAVVLTACSPTAVAGSLFAAPSVRGPGSTERRGHRPPPRTPSGAGGGRGPDA